MTDKEFRSISKNSFSRGTIKRLKKLIFFDKIEIDHQSVRSIEEFDYIIRTASIWSVDARSGDKKS